MGRFVALVVLTLAALAAGLVAPVGAVALETQYDKAPYVCGAGYDPLVGEPLIDSVAGASAISANLSGLSSASEGPVRTWPVLRQPIDLVAPTSAVDDVVRSADDILTPGGTRIGTAGSRTSIREVSGGLDDAQALFTDLSQGGTVVTSSSYPGTLVQLPNGGGTVGIRTTMTKSPGTIANIDVNIPGIDITKIKFN